MIQYQDPLFVRIANEPSIELTVFFLSRQGSVEVRDRDMGVSYRWDLPILEGYHHVFLPNLAPHGWFTGFLRHINPGIIPALMDGRFDALISMSGWGSLSTMTAFACCKLSGIPYFLYGDASFIETDDSPRFHVRNAIFRRVLEGSAGCMTMGTLNDAYYRHYGMPAEKLFLMPYAIDNERFIRQSAEARPRRAELRALYKIPTDLALVVFSGKLIERKNPMLLIEAMERMTHREQAGIVFVGDGAERGRLEAYVNDRGLNNVFFTGFVNQTELPGVLTMCDIFALPSNYDPRGTVANEAMACGLPIVISDRVGIYGEGDILREGENGFVIPPRDSGRLAEVLDRLVGDPDLRSRMGARSVEIIRTWDFESDVQGILEALRSLRGKSDETEKTDTPEEGRLTDRNNSAG